MLFYVIEWGEAAGRRRRAITPRSLDTRHIPRRRRPATDFVGIDRHKTSRRLSIITEDGGIAERRIKSAEA